MDCRTEARLQSLSDHFSNLVLEGYNSMAKSVFEHNLDILFDMQLHTLGTRMPMLHKQAAPLQVMKSG
jgi:predicted O-linked N-acetylglucosamine transferase (SPINDLY family)